MRLRTAKSVGFSEPNRPISRGRRSVAQARLALLVMINIAQMWILAAAVEAGLAHELDHLLPLSLASGICLVISLTIFYWWKPVGLAKRSINEPKG
ncbi:MAG: hypothetical protein UZ17_ACD001000303 [Acidobacteria bacterium OLB17]|nr:MAG: hypothetical protein UZ17_ACD001000303 [Acidobacteria bacterium OLB17]